MKKPSLIGTLLAAVLMFAACMVEIDYAGYCEMYVENESGHAVEFETYDEYGRNPQTVTIANGEKLQICYASEMGFAAVIPQRVFHDTVVFRFDDGVTLTHIGTLYEEYYIGMPYTPEDHNILDVNSWEVTHSQVGRHSPKQTGVYTLTEEDYNYGLTQNTPTPDNKKARRQQ